MATERMSGNARAHAVLARSSPEVDVGGFTRRDSTMIFYSLVNAVVRPDSQVLDLGAGRGAAHETAYPYKRSFLTLKGRVGRIVGVDVDPAVLENPLLDEAHVCASDAVLPFPDASFDVIFSDWVLEHVDDPEHFSAEVERLLKPGGWFFARTPNRFGVIAVAASLIPNTSHVKVLKKLQPDRIAPDVFPTRYRMNTLGALRRLFPDTRWKNCSSTLDAEVMYLAQMPAVYWLFDHISRVFPSAIRPLLLVAMQKRA